MADNTNKILGQFTLSAIPSLPDLLLAEMDALQNSGSSLTTLVRDDLFLFIRILQGGHTFPVGRHFDPEQLIARTTPEALSTLIMQSATRMGFARVSPQRLLFLKQLHLQSILARALAENIADKALPPSSGHVRTPTNKTCTGRT